MSTADRRALIVDAAIDLIAAQGLRALTHRALDAALELPAGSASYYFRSRRALLAGIVERIAARSRADFLAGGFDTPDLRDRAALARAIARWLDRLLAERRHHLIVRHALILELRADPELRARLAHGLFSAEGARDLFAALDFADPDAAAADFLAVLEGAVFDRFAGARADLPAGTPQNVDELAALLIRFLA
ncbi:TetR family transcriptional regulator [Nocardia panacis]|uniref:TetR family transcriptional regulator n=1 Tax=Nocardia panacis TaxID=2340916 RepID=A0A3A4JWW1_9NOCA|nr:TetR family transcriptional regulator [Nocardia panacis]RJO71251.1 TetR family transcriptional regulator [Nocardia panacis]